MDWKIIQPVLHGFSIIISPSLAKTAVFERQINLRRWVGRIEAVTREKPTELRTPFST